jgi:SAM-dependent methyltransferase
MTSDDPHKSAPRTEGRAAEDVSQPQGASAGGADSGPGGRADQVSGLDDEAPPEVPVISDASPGRAGGLPSRGSGRPAPGPGATSEASRRLAPPPKPKDRRRTLSAEPQQEQQEPGESESKAPSLLDRAPPKKPRGPAAGAASAAEPEVQRAARGRLSSDDEIAAAAMLERAAREASGLGILEVPAGGEQQEDDASEVESDAVQPLVAPDQSREPLPAPPGPPPGPIEQQSRAAADLAEVAAAEIRQDSPARGGQVPEARAQTPDPGAQVADKPATDAAPAATALSARPPGSAQGAAAQSGARGPAAAVPSAPRPPGPVASGPAPAPVQNAAEPGGDEAPAARVPSAPRPPRPAASASLPPVPVRDASRPSGAQGPAAGAPSAPWPPGPVASGPAAAPVQNAAEPGGDEAPAARVPSAPRPPRPAASASVPPTPVQDVAPPRDDKVIAAPVRSVPRPSQPAVSAPVPPVPAPRAVEQRGEDTVPATVRSVGRSLQPEASGPTQSVRPKAEQRPETIPIPDDDVPRRMATGASQAVLAMRIVSVGLAADEDEAPPEILDELEVAGGPLPPPSVREVEAAEMLDDEDVTPDSHRRSVTQAEALPDGGAAPVASSCAPVTSKPPPPPRRSVPTPQPPRPAQPKRASKAKRPAKPKRDAKSVRPKRRPWWEELFSEDFARAHGPLTRQQIVREVDFIEQSLGVAPGGVVLDLGCGQGHHAVELSGRGYAVVGYDLSLFQLALAADNAQERGQKINFLQGDMREMAFDKMFDGIYCWNTSFGYFEEEKNSAVAERILRALKPGGSLLLDVANRDFLLLNQPSGVWFEGDSCVCMDDMTVDFITSRMKVKRSIILDDGRTRESYYSIRVFSLHELGKLLHDVGFRVTQASGDPATPGMFFGERSPRIIVLAQRPPE